MATTGPAGRYWRCGTRRQDSHHSGLSAVGTIVKHRDELTKSSEHVLKHLAVSLLTDGQLPWLMDVDEARSTLTKVSATVETRAAKRKAEAEAAAEAEQREGERVGAARKAFRAMIAARPVKCHRIVRNTARADVFQVYITAYICLQ